MSVKLMTAAWASDLATGPKMVLLALCDNASDEGVCWPSITNIATKCSMGERTVQGHISTLCDIGAVERYDRPGKLSAFKVDPRRFCTPAESAPPQKTAQTPAGFAVAYIGEPSENRHKTPRRAALSPLPCPHGVEQQAWDDYLAMRRGKRSPMTITALDVLIREAAKAGITLQQAVEVCCARGWLSVKAEWLAPRSTSPAAPETAYARSMREKASVFAPGIAAPAPSSHHTTIESDRYGIALPRH